MRLIKDDDDDMSKKPRWKRLDFGVGGCRVGGQDWDEEDDHPNDHDHHVVNERKHSLGPSKSIWFNIFIIISIIIISMMVIIISMMIIIMRRPLLYQTNQVTIAGHLLLPRNNCKAIVIWWTLPTSLSLQYLVNWVAALLYKAERSMSAHRTLCSCTTTERGKVIHRKLD